MALISIKVSDSFAYKYRQHLPWSAGGASKAFKT